MSDFSKRINEILNHGALNLAMAIGYKNQIFDILEDLNKLVKGSNLRLTHAVFCSTNPPCPDH